MKVLTLLLVLLSVYNLWGQEQSLPKLEEYISDYKRKQFALDYEKNEVESLKLRDSWIMPINLSYRYNRSNQSDDIQTTKSASVGLSQPIFRSGGIYYGIKFADATKRYNDYAIDTQKRKLIKDAIALLIQIKQTDLRIEKQKKQIQNAAIKLRQNKEEYLNGQLDSGFLDNAVIALNAVKQALFDLEANKEKLISRFRSLSDINYESAYIPRLHIVTKTEFLRYNTLLRMYKSQVEKDKYATYTTSAKYLPSIALNASYTRDEYENLSFGGSTVRPGTQTFSYYNYGVSISLPLDVNVFRDIQSARVDFLKSTVVTEDKKRELVSLYEQVTQNIHTIEKKIVLAKENFDIYEKLLRDTQKLFEAGYKTDADVALLQNSMDMAQIDMEIFKLEKQLELLQLYEYYYGADGAL